MIELTGKTITTSDKTRVKVGAAFEGGGQGKCYAATNAKSGARLILKQFETASPLEFESVRSRTKFLVDARLHDISPLFHCPPRAWFADKALGVGHVAPVAPGDKLDELIERGWYPSFLDQLQLALALSHAISQLQSHGFVHGDLQGGNLFIEECTGSVLKPYLIDFDNYWHVNQPAPQAFIGMELYVAPELRIARKAGTSLPVDARAENYMVTAMMHMLILLRHPGHSATDDPDRFDKLMCSGRWADDPAQACTLMGGYPSQVLNVTLQDLMRRGLASDPDVRPPVTEWETALSEAVENVFVHEDCGGPVIVHRTMSSSCPHCGGSYPELVLSLLPTGSTLPVVGGGIRLGRDNLGGYPTISNHHANLERFGPEYRLTSLGSNGTYRASPSGWIRLPDRVPVLIQPGDRLRFAEAVEAQVG